MEARLAILLAWSTGWAWADPYPRQAGVDVEHYVFRIALEETSAEIRGEARVDFRFLQPGVREFMLDLSQESAGWGMRVDGIQTGGIAAAYVHESDRLTIQLPRPGEPGERQSGRASPSGITACPPAGCASAPMAMATAPTSA